MSRVDTTPFLWKVHFGIAALTIAVMACLAYVYLMGARINALHTPMADAAHHVEKDATLFHLWVEELITGNPAHEREEIFWYIDEAIDDTGFIVDGSIRHNEHYLSFDNPELRKLATSVLGDLYEFRRIAEKRLASVGPDGTSPVDDMFDGTFDIIMTQADDMEAVLEEMIERQLNTFARVQIGLIASCILLGLLVGLIVHRLERERYASIQERLSAQDALRDSQERLSLAMRASGAGIFDQELHPVPQGSVDARWAELLGYSADEVPPVDGLFYTWWESLLHPEDLPRFKDAHQQLLDGKIANYEIEARHWHKSGNWVYLIVFCSVARRDEHGHPDRIVGMVIDETTSRMSELENSRLATVVKQAGEAVVLLDVDGHVRYVNPAFERISGYQADELIGANFDAIKGDEQPSDVQRRMWEKVKGGESWSGLLVKRRKNGERYEVARTASPILDSGGTITGYAIMQRDVTYERQLQAKMQHADRLESLGVLAGGIAHDFNNLLTAIMGNASIAMMKLQNPPTGDGEGQTSVAEHLQRIEGSCKSAADLCRQMLAYSGKGKFEIKATNLSVVVEAMSKLMAVSIGKNVQVDFNLASSLPPVEADNAQIQQVIMNLITNASEAIGDNKGLITISTGAMYASKAILEHSITNTALPEGEYVYLRVTDNGCGMDANTKERIFDPFFTTKFTGRGLGMSAILGIVRGHNGALTLESQPGKGTCFTVMLPRKERAAGDEKEQVVTSIKTGSWRTSGAVLVIDDDEAIRETAGIMLTAKGLSVLTAEDGRQGVEMFRQHQGEIVAVLLDVAMPNMNGEECLRELKRIQPDVKVILSSGYTEDDATRRFAGLGLAGFVQKPYAAAQLHHRLREVLVA